MDSKTPGILMSSSWLADTPNNKTVYK